MNGRQSLTYYKILDKDQWYSTLPKFIRTISFHVLRLIPFRCNRSFESFLSHTSFFRTSMDTRCWVASTCRFFLNISNTICFSLTGILEFNPQLAGQDITPANLEFGSIAARRRDRREKSFSAVSVSQGNIQRIDWIMFFYSIKFHD